MVADGSKHYLFYSGNDRNTASYAVGVATCESVTGPCAKPLDAPWRSSSGSAVGPGGQEFFKRSGDVWMVHHGWLPDEVDTDGSSRRLFLDVLSFDQGSLPTRDNGAAAAAVAEANGADPGETGASGGGSAVPWILAGLAGVIVTGAAIQTVRRRPALR